MAGALTASSETQPVDAVQPCDENGSARSRTRRILLVITLFGAALRLYDLHHSPPGLNQDEASNAWNAYCLLKTGQDQHGVRWPLFYIRCLGENRTPLFIYLMMPFQAIGGLNVVTTRLPSAVLGVLSIPLLYYVAARLFGRNAGLFAAGLLALDSWHLQQCRWGHESAISPFLTIAPVALLLWANLPLGDSDRINERTLDTTRPESRARVFGSALAGAIAGLCCYGYPAVRLFLPTFLLVAVLVTFPAWWRLLKTRRGAEAVAALLLGVSITFGPLLWKHVTDAENINKRGTATWVWQPTDPTFVKVGRALERYADHFGLNFLFRKGDPYAIQAPPEGGQLRLYVLPLLYIGAIEGVRRLRRSRAARVMAAWVILYPVGDLLSRHAGMHALRSLPGLGGLILMAALGASTVASWIRPERRPYAGLATGLIVGALTLDYLLTFFGDFNRRGPIYHGFQADLVEACDWLRPRFDQYDAVFVTNQGVNLPYVITLVALGYEPAQWFRDERDLRTSGPWDVYVAYGKLHVRYGRTAETALREFRHNGRVDRVLHIVRPGELKLDNPVHTVHGPDGGDELLLFEESL